jgi:hypothetical protein
MCQSKIDRDKVFNTADFEKGDISIATGDQVPFRLTQFKRVEVVDVRPDSLTIGFRKPAIEIERKFLRFEKGLTWQLTNYINKNTTLSNDMNAPAVVLFIKDIWLREYDVDENEQDKMMDGDHDQIKFRKTSLELHFDCYVQKDDGYYAALRFDTTITKFLNIPQFSKKYFEYALTLAFNQLEHIDPNNIVAKKRKLSREAIDTHYLEQWQLSILTDTVLQKGAYNSFEEFKNNKPSDQRFELRKDKLADMLYIDNGAGGMTPTRDAWGYCDGKRIFIKSGENYFPLVLYGHSFYFLGSTEIARFSQRNGQTSYRTYYKNPLYPLKLNWQTGKPY